MNEVTLPPVSEWKQFKYTDLFEMTRGRGGKASDAKQNPGKNPYIGASAENNGVTFWTSLNPTEAEGAITVSNNGSVGSAFYQNKPFLASSDVSVLRLKEKPLNEQIGLFIVTVIEQEKAKYNYGRKWGLSRMKESFISLPVTSEGQPDYDLMERYINSLPFSADLYIGKAKSDEKVELPPTSKWKEFKYTDLFNLEKVRGPKVSEIKNTTGSTAYISATAENNGIKCFCDVKPEHEGKRITCGHLGDCFYQETPFVGSNVVVMNPKFLINRQIGLFMVTILNQNKFLFSYAGGGVAGLSKLSKMSLSLPVTSEGQPDYDLMERYINSLPYSDCL